MKSIKMLMMAAVTILSVSLFGQDTTIKKMKESVNKTEKIKYSCPMHPDQVSAKPGQCPKCGMNFTKSKKELMSMEGMKTYSCPMKCEGDKTYDKPGKCPKCGMALKEKEKQEIVYSCPMKCEGDKTYDKPGKCPKCGMNLTGSPKEKMKMEVMKTYTCPMHPDVTSDKPGKCSKCGMDLKEKQDDHSNHQH